MTAWPAIREAWRDGWSAPAPDGVRATAMDAGPSKKRIESTAVPAIETLTFKLSSAERDTLDGFYAANKALRFSYTHPVWGAVEAAFAGPIKWSAKGAWWLASVQMEIYR